MYVFVKLGAEWRNGDARTHRILTTHSYIQAPFYNKNDNQPKKLQTPHSELLTQLTLRHNKIVISFCTPIFSHQTCWTLFGLEEQPDNLVNINTKSAAKKSTYFLPFSHSDKTWPDPNDSRAKKKQCMMSIKMKFKNIY